MARLCAATLPLRGMRRQADCIRGFSFSLSLARSLTHPSTLVRLLPHPLFALFLSLRLIFFSLSWLLLSSLVRLPPSSPSQSLSLSFSSSSNTRAMRPTRARESRARYTTHMAGRPLLLAECAVLPPAGDRVTWPPGRNGTQRAARTVLSREPRTRHQSETNRETGPTDRILSPRKRVWCFLPPSLSPILSLSISLPLSISLSLALSPCTTTLSSLPPFPTPLFFGPVARATLSRSGTARVRPRVVPSDVPAATCQFPSVVCLRAAASCRKARGESRDRWSIGIFLCLRPLPSAQVNLFR